MKRLIDVLQAATDYLAARGVDHARLTMEQLMSHVLHCPRLQLYMRFETLLTEPELEALRQGLKRLAAGEPLQYVVGDTGFMGHTFKVDRRALIPRPDTEPLVERVLASDALWLRDAPALVEVGTGSGCIVISLALARPGSYVGIDAHAEALELALENATRLKVADRIQFREGDLLAGLAAGSADAVVANLPYIRTADVQTLPRHILGHEPLTALDGGVDGLDLIRRLIVEASPVLRPGGWLFLEIGCDQALAVRALLEAGGYSGVTVCPDLGGRDRVVSARRPER
jgi:release factor glutamine methyltransferase